MRTRVAGLATVAVAVVVVFGRALDPAMTFGGMDFLNLLYPQAVLVKWAFGAGEMPLWNWYEWAGSPLLAAMQSAPLYPPMWLALLLPLPYALQVYTIVHLVWAGCGAARLARWSGLDRPTAVFAAVGYACGGFYLGHIEQANSVAAISWGPWLIHALVRGVGEGGAGVSARQMMWLIVGTALALCAGHPQHVVLALLFGDVMLGLLVVANVRAGRMGVCADRSVRATVGQLLWPQIAVVGGLMLAAAQVLPTQELAGLSQRIWPYPDPNDPALKWKYLQAWVVPRFYNRLAGQPGQPVGYTELGLYCGILTFALFVPGVIALVRARLRVGVALLVTWTLSLLYGLGSEGGVSWLVYAVVPFLRTSRGAARALNVETLLFCIVAAHGLQALVRFAGERLGTRRAQFAFAGVAVVFVCADLAVTHSKELGLLLVETQTLGLAPPPKLDEGTGRVYRFMANDSDYYLDHSRTAIAERVRRLQPNLNVMDEVDLLDGYEEALLPTRHYANFLRAFNRNLRNGDNIDAPLLAMLGCNVMYTEYPLESAGPGWSRQAWSRGNRYSVWRSEYPTTWFLHVLALGNTQLTSDPVAEALMPTSTARMATQTQRLEHGFAGLDVARFSHAAEAAGIKITRRSTNRIEIESRGGEATWNATLFLQPWYPGWKARFTSAPREPDRERLRPAAPICSVFEVPGRPASGTIVYEPFSYRLGMFVSLLVAGGLAAGWVRRRFTRTDTDGHGQTRTCTDLGGLGRRAAGQ